MIRRIVGSATTQLYHHASSTKTIKSTSPVMPLHCISSASNNSMKDMQPKLEPETKNLTRRFVFPNSKITQLKAMASVRGVQNPTPTQVIGALISKRATPSKVTGFSRPPCALFQFVNTGSKIPQKTCVGNLRALSEQIKKRNMELKRSVENNESKNNLEEVFVLMNSPSGDGIEALISLEERCMSTLECDKQFLQFASLRQYG